MRKRITLLGLGATMIIAVFLAACGTQAPGVKGFSKGVITAKGSIFVNGVEFDTSTAMIKINGVPGTEAQLRVGMQVELRGRIDDASKRGSALEVHFDGSLKGKVDAVSPPSFTILGQTVTTDSSTVFESTLTDVASLLNKTVEVAGLPDASGVLLATHIEETGSSSFEIAGTIDANPGTAAGSFVLTPPNGGTPLKVAFTGGPLDAGIQAGTLVEVKFTTAFVPGPYTSTTNITTTAGKIEAKDELQPAEGERTEVQGFVKGLAAPNFTVEGVAVNAGSVSLAGISNGTKVEVEGTFTSGILYAEKIQIK